MVFYSQAIALLIALLIAWPIAFVAGLNISDVAGSLEPGMCTQSTSVRGNTSFHTLVRANTGKNRLTFYAIKIRWQEDLLVYRNTYTHSGDTWSLFGEGSTSNNPKVVSMFYHGDAGWGIPLLDVAFDLKSTVKPGIYDAAVTFETVSMVNAGTREFVRNVKLTTCRLDHSE